MKSSQIDVIIAVYNGEKFIEDAIVSARNQTWKDLNIIVADDGSTDETVNIVTALAKSDDRIILLTRPHQGVSATLNAAIQYSSAKYVAFLDADDLWDVTKLAVQMEALANSEHEVCFCMVQEFDTLPENSTQSYRARPEPMKGFSKISFLGKRSIFTRFGLFDESVAIGDFVDWFSRVVRAEVSVIILDQVLAFRRIHENNTTRNISKNVFLKLLKTHLDAKRKDS
ncbi:glycosyltransferase family 2 protein [Dyadobacter aurulentus]|uniref:glycosyltransferase family 2 protein n=1 Tax=Dyadobacter sp. UC 10 TaxID=2605428 RepID=UPI0011F2049A|nr:glycosyltransferase [Dyadobacter sp. UC 10]KAA0993492.1 glycosyltransferase [Dyadobacter sp. UC 10]